MAIQGFSTGNTGQQHLFLPMLTGNKSEWDKMLAQARMAMAMDGQTALGLALGKVLRNLWDQRLAEGHARDDLKEKRNAEIAGGKISDVDAFRAANGNPSAPTLDIPTTENNTNPPVTGETWERYSVLNGLPNDYKQATRDQVLPIPKFNGGLTQEELSSILDMGKNKNPFFFGGGF